MEFGQYIQYMYSSFGVIHANILAKIANTTTGFHKVTHSYKNFTDEIIKCKLFNQLFYYILAFLC